MNSFRKLCFALLLTLGCINQAQAGYYKVYSPTVEDGEIELEANLNADFDDRDSKNGYFSQVYGVAYGVNAIWKTELLAELEREADDQVNLTHLKWENIVTPFEQGKYWLDIGFYFEFEKALLGGSADAIEGKLLLEKSFGHWVNTANLKVAQEVGSYASGGINTGFYWRTKYKLYKEFEPGIEYYGKFGSVNNTPEFDDQKHIIGPVVQGKYSSVKYDAGVFAGITNGSPDCMIKLNLEYEF